MNMPGIEIINNSDEMENHVSVTDIADLLLQQFIIITGKNIVISLRFLMNRINTLYSSEKDLISIFFNMDSLNDKNLYSVLP